MKKKSIVISIVIAALVTIATLCFPYYRAYRSAKVSNIVYSGLNDVFRKLDQVKPTLRHKNYYYFSSWNTRCDACIEEMLRLDSIADGLSSNIGYIYVSDDSDEKAKAFLKKKGIASRNFTYLNNMDDFISAVYHSRNEIQGVSDSFRYGFCRKYLNL